MCFGYMGERVIRLGLLGCGRIAKRHSDPLGGGHIAGAKLVAVCDEVGERTDAIASRFDVPALYNLDDLLGRTAIDAVSVLTPSGMHPRHAIAVAKAGKHLIVEKPMALGRLTRKASPVTRGAVFGPY
jgi:UDP-N-acetyl-2-amino-2-deoxyglucuronate dehydrogenase